MNKQTKFNWRDGELQYAQFSKLPSTAKQEHIEFLLSLPKEQLGSNDEYILRIYGPTGKTSTNYFTLNEE